MKTNQKEIKKPDLSFNWKSKVHTIVLDTSSDTSPSAPSLSSNTESQNTATTQTRNVTPVTPSKRPRSRIPETTSITSSFTTNRPHISEIPISSRSQSQPSLIHTPLVHIRNPESVEGCINYKQPTAIKIIGLPPQLNLVHIPDIEYARLLHYKYHLKQTKQLQNYFHN